MQLLVSYPLTPMRMYNNGNGSLQQQFGNSSSLTLAYGASKGTHLTFDYFALNQLPDQDLALGNALVKSVANPFAGIINARYGLGASTIPAGQLLLKFPQYSQVYLGDWNQGDSTYNSLQVTAQKRFGKGASVNLAYTWAKLLSDTDDLIGFAAPDVAAVVQDYNNLRAEKSLSTNDVRHRVAISYVYDLPFGRGRALLSNLGKADYLIGGWGLEGVTTLQSGFPLSFLTNQNLTNSFGGGSRPNYISGCVKSSTGSAVSRLNQWFNTSCFTQPAAFTFGNEPRTDPSLRAAGIANWDSALFKNFPIPKLGDTNLQFRAEAFNVFNRVQFGYPGMVQGQAGFGVVSSQINNPRLLQFALRINF